LVLPLHLLARAQSQCRPSSRRRPRQMCLGYRPTGSASTPETPAESEPAVVTAAAARFAPAGILAAIGAIALF
ncbi:hypothetical protein CEP51_014534, partial [Fusarium floridanum]